MSSDYFGSSFSKAVSALFVVVGVFAVVVVGLCATVAYSWGTKHGTELGRTDIASGRVIGERVTNADGLTEWRWKEAGK